MRSSFFRRIFGSAEGDDAEHSSIDIVNSIDVTDSDTYEDDCISPFCGKFLRITSIGRGRYAWVWKSRNKIDKQFYALKVYFNSISPDERLQIFRKYRAMSRLRHPNLMPIQECVLNSEQLVVVMPFYENGSVMGWRGKLSEREVLAFIRDVANALRYLHANGIVHGDVKPSNILITLNRSYVLSDFCMCSGTGDDSATIIRSRNMYSPYIPPELRGGNGRPSPSNDIWSLGVSIYEMVTGDIPLAGVSQFDYTILPIWAKKLVAACLNPTPSMRPTANDILSYLEDKSNLSSSASRGTTVVTPDFTNTYSAKALRTYYTCRVHRSPKTGLCGVVDERGNLLVNYNYESISEFCETAWPGPGPGPLPSDFFLGAFYSVGNYIGGLRILNDGRIIDSGRLTKQEFRARLFYT